MYIIGIYGMLRSGKTLTAILLSTLYKQRGYTIYSNMHGFKLSDHYIQDFRDTMLNQDANDNTRKKLLVLDEIYLLADSRTSGSKLNKLYSYLVMQSGKLNYDIIYTTNYFKNLDIRIRNLTNRTIYTKFAQAIDQYGNKIPDEGILNIQVFDEVGIQMSNKFITIHKPLFDLYNTYERIEIPNLDQLLNTDTKKKKEKN